MCNDRIWPKAEYRFRDENRGKPPFALHGFKRVFSVPSRSFRSGRNVPQAAMLRIPHSRWLTSGSQGRTALKIVSRGRCCLTKGEKSTRVRMETTRAPPVASHHFARNRCLGASLPIRVGRPPPNIKVYPSFLALRSSTCFPPCCGTATTRPARASPSKELTCKSRASTAHVRCSTFSLGSLADRDFSMCLSTPKLVRSEWRLRGSSLIS